MFHDTEPLWHLLRRHRKLGGGGGLLVWAAETQAFVIWCDAVWACTYAELDNLLAGERTQPVTEALTAELPELV